MAALIKFWKRNSGLVISMIVALAFSISMMIVGNYLTNTTVGNFLINVGFLVLGALIAIFTTLLSEAIKRPAQARDLARALYEELADRVARCCFDFEAPWSKYVDVDNCEAPGEMGSFRLRKFSPAPPIIYPSTASQLAILENDAPQAIIKFYFRLAVWQRDVENIASESQQNYKGAVLPEGINLLAWRLRQTLSPGLRALQALAPLVEEFEKIEAAAVAGYDEGRKGGPAGTLRERIGRLIA